MPAFTVELTDLEVKSLGYVAVSPSDWIQNAVRERCRLAMEEMVNDTIQFNLANSLPLAPTKEEIAQASTLPNAVERNAAVHAQALATMVPVP